MRGTSTGVECYLIDKVDHGLDAGHVVVVDGDVDDGAVEPGLVVGALAAEVVDAVAVAVVRVHEGRNVADGVAVPRPEALAGEGHGDDPLRHVGQVEVDPVLLVPPLVLKLRKIDG